MADPKKTMGHPLALHPKTAATGGGVITGGVIVWLLGLANVAVDPITAVALAGAVATFFAWLAPLIESEFKS